TPMTTATTEPQATAMAVTWMVMRAPSRRVWYWSQVSIAGLSSRQCSAGEVLDGHTVGGVDLGVGEAERLDDRKDLVVVLHLVEDVVEGVAELLVLGTEGEGAAAELLLAVDDRHEAV